ncbi:MAG: hypothetical protein ABEH43_04765, partial [Flavobacteriales bacterium]
DAADTYTLESTNPNLTADTSNGIKVRSTCAIKEDTLVNMAYNLLNFPDGWDCGNTMDVPARWDTLRTIVQYIKPDALMVVELDKEYGADSILNQSLNVNGVTVIKKRIMS